jgi:hypothetical protein
MKNKIYLVGMSIVFLNSCAISDNSQLGNSKEKACSLSFHDKSLPCEINMNYKTSACYITKSNSGCIVISNKKPSCALGTYCKIPACSTVLTSVNGKIVETKTPCQ